MIFWSENTQYKQFYGSGFEPKKGTLVEWKSIFKEMGDVRIEDYLENNSSTIYETVYNALYKYLKN